MESEAVQCPSCGHMCEPVKVAGHTQCPFCTRVIDECCSGETVEIVDESESK
jgi:hypothetical protein